MVKFAWNNAKNANIDLISFESNYGYDLDVSLKENKACYFYLKTTDKLEIKPEKNY